MLKAASVLLSRKSAVLQNSTFSSAGFFNNTSPLRNFAAQSGSTASGQNFGSKGVSSNIFADFTIFKGKAALVMSPSLPKFVKQESGASFVEKKGVIFLKFAPAIGLRKYDFEKKQYFALNPTEVGCLIGLGPNESCDFVHDPSMKSSLEGQVKKTLSIKPAPSDDGGYFFSLTVNNSILKTTERFYVPVTKAEFTLMRTAFSFILPHIMGWDRVVTQQPENAGQIPPGRNFMRPSPASEWDR